MRTTLVLAAVAVCLGAPRPSRGSPPSDRFSLILDYTPTGWSAKCESGCTWSGSFSCPSVCDAQVDAHGIITLANARPLDSLFAFTVSRMFALTDDTQRSRRIWVARRSIR